MTSSLSTLSRGYSSRPMGMGESEGKEKRKKTTVLTLKGLYDKKEAISMMTAHDYPSAVYVDKAGIEILLVGDSLAMVALGYSSTTQITMDVRIIIHPPAAPPPPHAIFVLLLW